jgi:HK97 family phage portal protein
MMPDGSMRLAAEHKNYDLIHSRPNPNMSSMTWRTAMIASVCSNGNGYSWIKRDGAARAVAFIPLASEKTSPVKVLGKLMYATTQTDNGQAAFIDPQHILHFMNFSLDGIVGLSPIGVCKNCFGLGLAAEKYGCQFFGNGARASGVFSHPDALDEEARENLVKSVRERANGENALSPMVLEEGMKWTQMSIPPNEAQFIATRQWQKEEVTSLYRVPLHLVQSLLRATNNNIEHQGLDYVRFCLAPRAVNFEQEINYKILAGPYVCEHNFMDLTRGDFASQTAGLMLLRNGGVYHANDVLRTLRQTPIPEDEGGNIRIVQGANVNLTALLAQPEEESPAPGDRGDTDSTVGDPAAQFRRRQITASYRTLFRDAVGRAINRAGEPEFARRALQPAVSSMTQTILASRFGNVEMTRRELDMIGRQTAQIAADAPGWHKKDATAIAARITEQVYAELSKEILQ